jgi:hypothetical protein
VTLDPIPPQLSLALRGYQTGPGSHPLTKENLMAYVIKNTDTGKFVTKSGSEHSYSTDVRRVRIFDSRQQAVDYGLCANEIVEQLSDRLKPGMYPPLVST